MRLGNRKANNKINAAILLNVFYNITILLLSLSSIHIVLFEERGLYSIKNSYIDLEIEIGVYGDQLTDKLVAFTSQINTKIFASSENE